MTPSWEDAFVSQNILTIVKILVFMQTVVTFSSSQTHCPSEDLTGLKYGCVVEINYTATKIACYDCEYFEKAFFFKLPDTHLLTLQINDSLNTVNKDSISSLRTTFISTMSSNSTSFYICRRGTTKTVTSNNSKATQLCSLGFDCFALFPNIIDDAFIRSIEIVNKTIIRFGDLKSMLNLNMVSITKTKEIQFEEQATTYLVERLSLVHSKLSDLPSHFLVGNSNLRHLDVANNLISDINTTFFKHIYDLEHLDLSNNVIKDLRNDTFNDLPNLTFLNLSTNVFQDIPSEIFKENRLLEFIDLSNNNIVSVSKQLLWKLKKIRQFSVSKCKLIKLKRDFFRDCHQMEMLDLSHNEIIYLPGRVFSGMGRLRYLDLGYNKLTLIPKSLFLASHKLSYLSLKNNQIKQLPEGLISNVDILQELDVSENKLESFRQDYFEDFVTVERLNLSRNKLKTIELPLHEKFIVHHFDLSVNDIENIQLTQNSTWSFKNIDFSFNRITELRLPFCLQNENTALTFSFQHNNISTVDIQSEPEVNVPESEYHGKCLKNRFSNVEILLSNNPFNCDGALYEFFIKISKRKAHYSIPDHSHLICKHPTRLAGAEFLKLEEEAFVYSMAVNCPEPCTCGKRAKDNSTVLDCSSANLDKFYSSTLVNATILYFQNNRLKKLKDIRTPNWDNIVELRLDHNMLESINTLYLPKSLQILSATHNQIRTIAGSFQNLTAANRTFALFLANNTKQCKCDALNLKHWLQNHSGIVRDIENITCEIEEASGTKFLPLYNVPESYLCLQEYDDTNFVPPITIFSIFTFFILVFVLFYYKNKQTILAFAYIHFGCLFRCSFGSKEMDQNKEYDAFIAYSSTDRELVMDIVKELENKEPFFNLCIHERNWLPGNYISENIAYSVQNSSRTIIILSEDFVSSIWFAVEVRTALFQMIQDKFDRLIFILVGSLPAMDIIDEDIKQVLNRKTYLEWGNRWFWERLRYAMPHPTNSSKKGHYGKQPQEEKLMHFVENEIAIALAPV